MASFDDIVNELQGKIFDEAVQAYGQAGFERWRNKPYHGRPEKAEYTGAAIGTCGDTIRIHLHIENDMVRDAGFETDGCGSSQVCGSMAAELAVNKKCEELTAITGDTVLEALGGPACMPEEDRHCTRLAANALHEALGDYYFKTLGMRER